MYPGSGVLPPGGPGGMTSPTASVSSSAVPIQMKRPGPAGPGANGINNTMLTSGALHGGPGSSASAPPPAPICDWRHTQAFGDDNSSSDDLVTSVAFDCTGNFLAVGDNAGRICIFEAADAFGSSIAAVTAGVSSITALAHSSRAAEPPLPASAGLGPEGAHGDGDRSGRYFGGAADAEAALAAAEAAAMSDIRLRGFAGTGFAGPGGAPTGGAPGASRRPGAVRLVGAPPGSGLTVSTSTCYTQPGATRGLGHYYLSAGGGPGGGGAGSGGSGGGGAGGAQGGAGASGGAGGIGDGVLPSTPQALLAGGVCHSLPPSALEYRFYTEFQSHEPEFDALKSSEIEEKINMLRWMPAHSGSQLILATNDKTIKLWKLRDRPVRQVTRASAASTRVLGGSAANVVLRAPGTVGELVLPQEEVTHTVAAATRKRVFTNAHAYYINSIAASSDGETFVSADDVRVHLWHLDSSRDCFNIVDIKPSSMEETTDVITAVDFHPTACNLLLYASSRGAVRLVDLRDAALCDQHARIFEMDDDPANKTFFSEITSSVADARFSPDGRHIFSRDYTHIRLWDTRMEARPVSSVPVHDHFRTLLCDLYENDCIFDKFSLAASCDGLQVASGTYSNSFVVHNFATGNTVSVEATQQQVRRKPKPAKPATGSVGSLRKGVAAKDRRSDSPDISSIDFGKKSLHLSWHPRLDCIAVAGLNKLYLYQAQLATDKNDML
jgi:serine/threonine-protein phosphatase 2A regulatory subunit B